MNEIKKRGVFARPHYDGSRHVEVRPGVRLTDRQYKYVEALTNPNSETYGDRAGSIKAAGYKSKTPDLSATILEKNENVRVMLRELMSVKSVDKLIMRGVYKRLKNPDSKNWLPTAEYVSKIRGDFAPDKVIQANLSYEEKQKKLEDIERITGKSPVFEEVVEVMGGGEVEENND